MVYLIQNNGITLFNQFLDSGLRSVPLAGNDFIQDRTVGTVFGWGPETPFDPTLSPALRGVDVDIFSTSTCASRFHPDLITKRLFCAGAIRGGRDGEKMHIHLKN